MNKSDDTVLVNPRSFQYQPLGPNSLTQVATTKLAIDPERKLLELDLQESREIADARNSSTAELVSMTTNTVSGCIQHWQRQTPGRARCRTSRKGPAPRRLRNGRIPKRIPPYFAQ